ncbi:MAG: 5-formyltetrahydrofolate cyclo-ligase [Oscillospiraceae bacterium]
MGRPENIKAYKIALRVRLKERRRAMEDAQKQEADRRIFERLCALPGYRGAKIILIYVSTPIEVDTQRIIEAALREGKQVAVPRCVPNSREMEFYRIESLAELSPGTFGVAEPQADPQRLLTDWRESFCVIPALGCDRRGFRLGYGGGYYDRFLNRYSGEKAVILYHNCLLGMLWHGRYDVPVDQIVTEHGVLRIGEARSGRPGRRHSHSNSK